MLKNCQGEHRLNNTDAKTGFQTLIAAELILGSVQQHRLPTDRRGAYKCKIKLKAGVIESLVKYFCGSLNTQGLKKATSVS